MPSLVLYDSLSGCEKSFAPADPAHITAYLCGPTVYGEPHIGNARPAVVADVAIKYLRRHYPEVTFVRNITDIDDKIIERANENGESTETLAARMQAHYNEVMTRLNVAQPDIEPKATQYIAEMIEAIAGFHAGRHAYTLEDGTMLFDVGSVENYGDLSGQTAGTLEGARVEVDENKRDPRDFVLWKPAKEGEPAWQSPWGSGRPGWHTECAVMISEIFPSHIDLHFGGVDLKFPHHENERAQTKCMKREQVGCWVHNALLTVEGDKMSKSLGNIISIAKAIEKYGAMTTRLALLSTQYRHPLHWRDETVQLAQNRLAKFQSAYTELQDVEAAGETTRREEAMEKALSQDLCTPELLAVLAQSAKNARSSSSVSRAEARRELENGLAWLGLEPALSEQSTSLSAGEKAEVEVLIAQRNEARARKDWSAADTIRDRLLARNIHIDDTAQGTTWRVGKQQ